jgi:anti-anti-sigma regulatory factor
MLRITKTFEDQNSVDLRLDGRVAEATVGELEQAVAEHRNGQHKAIVLDFGGVVFISDAGIEILRKVKDKRVTIRNCSLFVKTLLGDLSD